MGGEITDPAAIESDARLVRMDRVAILHGEITAATREFLRALADCDRHRDWAGEGFGSCAEWLAWRIGVTRNTANEKVRAARALEGLPLISEAMARGEISFTKVRALTRVGTPDNEAELLDYAKSSSAAGLEKLIRSYRTLSPEDEARREQLRHASRCFSVFPDEDGMYVVKGRLDPEVGAVLMRAIEAASDVLFRAGDGGAEGGDGRDDDDGDDGEGNADDGDARNVRNADHPEPAQRRADAVGLLAERALAAGFSAGTSRAERYQVTLYMGEDASELEDGTPVTAETARRVACDAGRVDVRTGPDGAVLSVGRKTRTVPPSIRRALEARDRGCRFPGCGVRFTDAHHIVHWSDGGETALHNLVLLCRRHHRRVHEDGFSVCSDRKGRQIVFFSPTGHAMAAAPPPARLTADPAAELMRRNRRRGVAPTHRSGGQRYRRDVQIPWALEAATRDALDPG